MSLGPQPYPVIYDTTNGLQYVFESGPTVLVASSITGVLLTGYVSGAGTVAATDTILQAINKLNGNDALKLPLTGGTLTGGLTITSTTAALIPPRMTSTQRDAIATPTKGSMIYNTSTDALNYYDGTWQVVAKV